LSLCLPVFQDGIDFPSGVFSISRQKQRDFETKTVVGTFPAVKVLRRSLFAMRCSKVLQKLRNGEVARICVMGDFIPHFPHVAAHFGYDGIWMDGEHHNWNPREIETVIAQHRLADIDCVWRPPTLEKSGLARILEDGATALMIPQVNTAQHARQLVTAAKFPPIGDRGLDGAGMDAGFWVQKAADYPGCANRETFLVVQIETPLAVQNVDAIADVEGVDVLFIGPSDLSLRLGCEGSLQAPPLRAAIETTIKACAKSGKYWGYPAVRVEDAKTAWELGCKFLVLGSAFWAIHDHLKNCSLELDKILSSRRACTSENLKRQNGPVSESKRVPASGNSPNVESGARRKVTPSGLH
jgi:4-hydroxy-2-oxoheptanedioate aldolase